MGSIKVFKLGDKAAPRFPERFEIVRRAVLQATDIRNNHNKYYALELHQGSGASMPFRLFTHYGRTDDLQTNPQAGQRECRFFANLAEAIAEYDAIYRQKTSPTKGYREVSLAAAAIGSAEGRGKSAGHVDQATLTRLADKPTPAPQTPAIPQPIARLVRYLYAEATTALTTTVAATITARGIETPLGILTVGQIEKGEHILAELYELFSSRRKNRQRLIDLSSEFYSAIPHRIGRSRDAIESAVIDSMPAFEQKQETLQLMKDMLAVDGDKGVLFADDVAKKYQALDCDLRLLDPQGDEHQQVAAYFASRLLRNKALRIRNVFAMRRRGEHEAFATSVGNDRQLFHGSRIKNWVGVLSRGLVLPRIAVSMGVTRTDAGWLGNGIYFGDAPCTAAYYTSPGREGTRFMAIARVALGKTRDYTKITYGLTAPPAGFDSCHGVRARPGVVSEFADDEYVVYDQRQQRLEYLVEFSG